MGQEGVLKSENNSLCPNPKRCCLEIQRHSEDSEEETQSWRRCGWAWVKYFLELARTEKLTDKVQLFHIPSISNVTLLIFWISKSLLWGCSVHGGKFCRTPSLSPLMPVLYPHPWSKNKKCGHTSVNGFWGWKLCWMGTTILDYWVSLRQWTPVSHMFSSKEAWLH